MEGENGSAASPPLAASARWNPSSAQLAILETLYNDGLRTPSPEQIREITERLNEYGRIEAKNVFYWFQNHKARERQKERQENMPFPGGLVPNPRPDVLGSPLYLQAPQVVQAPQVMQAPQVGHPAGFYQYPPQYYPPAPVNGMQMTEMPPPPPPWLRENPTAPVNRMQMTEMPPPAPWMRENAAAGVNRMQMTEMPPPPPWMRENAAAAVNRRHVAQMAPPPWMRLFNKRRPPVANSSVPAYLQGTPLDPNFIRNQELLMHAANARPAPTHRTLDLFPQHPTGILKEKFAGSSQATASVEEPEGNSNEGGEDVGGQAKMSMFDFFGTSPKSN